jgi:hypothetical protein
MVQGAGLKAQGDYIPLGKGREGSCLTVGRQPEIGEVNFYGGWRFGYFIEITAMLKPGIRAYYALEIVLFQIGGSLPRHAM